MRDPLEERGLHGQTALALVARIATRDDRVMLSDLHTKEFSKLGHSVIQVHTILQSLDITLTRANVHRAQLEEMARVKLTANIPRNDILHAIIARDNDAVLVSRDRHFVRIRHVTKAFVPEDLA